MRAVALLLLVSAAFAPTLACADAFTDPVPAPTAERDRAIGCLATAIAYEAGHEPVAGQQAVAEVILNRQRHASFPKTVCGVVYAGSARRTGCQFSFTCDGSLNRAMSEAVMINARTVATLAFDGLNPARVGGATHYHADYVSPYWAPSLIRVTKIGAHIFYRGAGSRDARFASDATLPGAQAPADASEARLIDIPNLPVPAKLPAIFAPWGLAPPKAD